MYPEEEAAWPRNKPMLMLIADAQAEANACRLPTARPFLLS
jgi:hypothetical protein